MKDKNYKKNAFGSFPDVDLLPDALDELAYIQDRAREIEKQRYYYDVFEETPSMASRHPDRGGFKPQLETVDQEIQDSGLIAGQDTAYDESIDDDDWDLFDTELPEYDESPTRKEFVQVDTGGQLTRQERALQEAALLGRRYGWNRAGIELLAEVFEIYGWSAARRAMERELEAGLRPQELFLALEARKIWEDHGAYWQSQSDRHLYSTLSWPLALDIVRSFIGYPDTAEIEAFLCNAYSFWDTNPHLMRSYTSFYFYLRTKLLFPHKDLLVNPVASMGDQYDPRDDGFLGGAYVLYDLLPNELFEAYG